MDARFNFSRRATRSSACRNVSPDDLRKVENLTFIRIGLGCVSFLQYLVCIYIQGNLQNVKNAS